MGIFWGDISISFDFIRNQKISEYILTGGLGSSLGKSLFSTYFTNWSFFKQPAGVGGEYLSETPLNMYQDKGSEPGSGSESESGSKSGSGKDKEPELGSESGSGKGKEPVIWRSFTGSSKVPLENTTKDTSSPGTMDNTPWYVKILAHFKEDYMKENKSIIDKVKDIENILGEFVPKDPDLKNASSDVINVLGLQQARAEFLRQYFQLRADLLNNISLIIRDNNELKKIEEILTRKEQIHRDYLNKVDQITEWAENTGSVDKRFLKLYFDATNTYRNQVRKELTTVETIIQKNMQSSPEYKVKEFKKMLTTDYRNATIAFNNQEERVKVKLAEIFDKPKQKK